MRPNQPKQARRLQAQDQACYAAKAATNKGEAMKLLFSFVLFCSFALLTIPEGATASETEWPQWRGPLRNGLSSETGLLKQWPEKGPAVTWSITNLGEGYGSVALKADRIYVQGTSGAAGEAKSTVFC